jgi:hypothetical protein
MANSRPSLTRLAIASAAATAQESQSVDRSRAWWILLPIGLGLLTWAPLHDCDGSLEGHEQPDRTSLVLKKVVNGDSIRRTGARRNDWLEVANGRWVWDVDVRDNRNTAQLT